MAIIAENTGKTRELIPTGNYVARCYQMIQIGTVKETFEGETKILHKVRIGWELPEELRVFDESKGEQPLVMSAEYTLSMHEKAKLRGVLQSWRGKAFTDDEAKSFDITKLIGAPCLLNVIHKTNANGTFANVSGITPLPKGLICHPAINKPFVLSFDDWDDAKFNSLPDFIKAKIASSLEYEKIRTPHSSSVDDVSSTNDEQIEQLPF